MADRYEVTTNASLLTQEISDKLIESGMTRLLISAQGVTEESYRKVCGFKLNMTKFLNQIAYFYEKSRGICELYIKTVSIALKTDEEKQKFHDMFSQISDFINIENIIESSEGVDFSAIVPEEQRHKNRYNMSVTNKKCCDTLFMYMNIHSNGDVDCCGCIYPPMYIGNIYKEPLKDLWNGKVHKSLMIKHLTGKRNTIDICAKCESINNNSGFEEDNLDPYCDEILERVESL